MERVERFIGGWKDDAENIKPIFTTLLKELLRKDDVKIEFNERPGISYSLRGIQKNQRDRPLFVMIDVIDDDPEERWLSVCFYGDMIKDPEELGDLIPAGLLGADGHCFDITESDEHLETYVCKRIREAYESTQTG